MCIIGTNDIILLVFIYYNNLLTAIWRERERERERERVNERSNTETWEFVNSVYSYLHV